MSPSAEQSSHAHVLLFQRSFPSGKPAKLGSLHIYPVGTTALIAENDVAKFHVEQHDSTSVDLPYILTDLLLQAEAERLGA
jgi:hypothetical protein